MFSSTPTSHEGFLLWGQHLRDFVDFLSSFWHFRDGFGSIHFLKHTKKHILLKNDIIIFHYKTPICFSIDIETAYRMIDELEGFGNYEQMGNEQ